MPSLEDELNALLAGSASLGEGIADAKKVAKQTRRRRSQRRRQNSTGADVFVRQEAEEEEDARRDHAHGHHDTLGTVRPPFALPDRSPRPIERG